MRGVPPENDQGPPAPPSAAAIANRFEATSLLPIRRSTLPGRQGEMGVPVGTPVTGRPPDRSVRAGFPHTAPTLDAGDRSGHSGKGEGCVGGVAIGSREGRTFPRSTLVGRVGFVAAESGTSVGPLRF